MSDRAEWEIVLACKSPPQVWDFFPTMEAAAAKKEDADSYNVKLQAHGAPFRTFEPMTYDEFKAAQRAHYLSHPLREITAEQYDEMLNVLPPRNWERRDGCERFLMSEFTDGTFTAQYARRNERYFTRTVDAFDRATWVTGEEIDRQPAAQPA